jgi:hypothetical protein
MGGSEYREKLALARRRKWETPAPAFLPDEAFVLRRFDKGKTTTARE